MRKKFHLFREIFPKLPTFFFYLLLKRRLKDCMTILDVGCGSLSPLRFIDGKTYGVDVYKPAVRDAKKNMTHNAYEILDIKKLTNKFKPKSFDAVIALDVIEHLKKQQGERLINQMEQIATKRVIIFTPNGFLPQEGESIYSKHLSGWSAGEMRDKGYQVSGIYGPKKLRGDKYRINFKPEFLWAGISELIQWSFIYYNPEHAAGLLCIKDIKN